MDFLLLHGGWQGGWCWDGVAAALRERGHVVQAPTLPGYADVDEQRATAGLASMARAATSLVEGRECIVVGHSGGGPVAQLVAAQLPEPPTRIVFIDAWVLHDGERVFDVIPPAWEESSRHMAQSRPDNAVPVDPELWGAVFMNDADPAQVAAASARLVPTPLGSLDEPVRLLKFWERAVPASYIFLEEDIAVPPEIYRQMAARLTDPITTTSPGAHEAMLTRPVELADALMRVCPEINNQ